MNGYYPESKGNYGTGWGKETKKETKITTAEMHERFQEYKEIRKILLLQFKGIVTLGKEMDECKETLKAIGTVIEKVHPYSHTDEHYSYRTTLEQRIAKYKQQIRIQEKGLDVYFDRVEELDVEAHIYSWVQAETDLPEIFKYSNEIKTRLDKYVIFAYWS
jgi:Tat protein secretion system quality control protein TatD with DNase activity